MKRLPIVNRFKLTASIDISARSIQVAVVTVIVIAAFFVSRGNVGVAVFCGILGASVCGLADPRLSIVGALLCLVFYPILDVVERNAWLQQSPLVSYYVAKSGIYSIRNVMDTMMTWAFGLMCIGLLGRLARYVVQREKSFDHA